MSVLSVSYDLIKRKDYPELYKALRTYTHCHMMDSYWLLDTAKSVTQVRDHLKEHIDSDDYLFVVRLHKNWASNRTGNCIEWLKDASRSWD